MKLLEGTRERLRDSAIAAMGLKQDDVAAQLLEILNAKTIDLNSAATNATQIPLPLAGVAIAARGIHEWADILHSSYLPEVKGRSLTMFTAHELLGWAERSVELSEEDRCSAGGRPRWRCRISDALNLLCKQGYLARQEGTTQTYLICSPPEQTTVNQP